MDVKLYLREHEKEERALKIKIIKMVTKIRVGDLCEIRK